MTRSKHTIGKAWGEGPQLTLISQNNINGGGPNLSYVELTGYKVALNTPKRSHTGPEPTAIYNLIHHS